MHGNTSDTGDTDRMSFDRARIEETTEKLRRMILSNASADEIKAEALKEGMITMQRDGMLKAKLGTTSYGEVIRATFTMY